MQCDAQTLREFQRLVVGEFLISRLHFHYGQLSAQFCLA